VTKASERRNFWRAVFNAPVRLTTHDGQVYAQLLDISLKGALLETGTAWNGKAGEECQLNLGLALGTNIVMWTKVMHVEGRNAARRGRATPSAPCRYGAAMRPVAGLSRGRP
jgi:hypothetical protein